VSDFNENLNYLERFSKNTPISHFTKIRPVGTGLFHADRQTDMTKLTVAFHKTAKSTYNGTFDWNCGDSYCPKHNGSE
jgi:hypothetical protein